LARDEADLGQAKRDGRRGPEVQRTGGGAASVAVEQRDPVGHIFELGVALCRGSAMD
jgi:hypothetical protein